MKPKHLTIDAFIRRLAKVPVKWKMATSGNMRAFIGTSRVCPITAVDPCHQHPLMWKWSSKQLGLDARLARRIMNAADNRIRGDASRTIRRRLLRACKLTEAK